MSRKKTLWIAALVLRIVTLAVLPVLFSISWEWFLIQVPTGNIFPDGITPIFMPEATGSFPEKLVTGLEIADIFLGNIDKDFQPVNPYHHCRWRTG